MTSSETETGRGRLLRSSLVVASMTLVSRVLGLIRDVVIAFTFGAGPAAEAFIVAFRIPNFLRRLFAEGAFSQAFVPVLSEYRTKRSHEDVRALVDRVAGNLGALLLLVTAIGVLAAPVLVAAFAPGFLFRADQNEFWLAASMLRITFPYLLLISLTAMAGAILNSYGRFAPPAFTPVLLNVSLISGAVFVSPLLAEPILALAWAVLAAGILQLLFQLPFLSQLDLLPRPKVDRHDEGVRRILALMLPVLFAVSVGQVNLLFDTLIASFLVPGSIPWLYYADRLLELPLALFGIAIATVILPSLSAEHANASEEEFAATLDWALRMVVLVGAPASVALVVLAEPLVLAVFLGGDFTMADVDMAALALMAYGLGLLGHMFVKVLAPGYFSRQDTTTPVRIAVIAMVTNMVLNLVLIWPLGHAGLALATSLAAFVNCGLLFRGLITRGVYRARAGWVVFAARVAVGLGAMGAYLAWVPLDLAQLAEMTFVLRLGYVAVVCAGGALVYFGALAVAGVRPAQLRR